MSRYITLPPRAYWDNDGPVLEGKTVHVEDDGPVKTGLLDATGAPLYRLSEKIRPGFYK